MIMVSKLDGSANAVHAWLFLTILEIVGFHHCQQTDHDAFDNHQ